MKQDVIISIRHPFADKIYSGEKLFEFRKRRPNIAVGTRCWIYEPLPIGKVTGFFIYRGCYRDEKAKVWEHCQENAGINREAFMQYYDRDFYAYAWQVGTARRCPAFDLKDAGIDRAPQSYITWSSEFLDNLIITMNERKELNDKLRDLILEIRGKKGFAAYRVGNGWLSMSELIKDDGKLLMIKPWEPDSHSQRIHITLRVSPGALESTKEGWDLLQFVQFRASSVLIKLMKERGARAAVVCEKGSLTAISDEVDPMVTQLHIVLDVFEQY